MIRDVGDWIVKISYSVHYQRSKSTTDYILDLIRENKNHVATKGWEALSIIVISDYYEPAKLLLELGVREIRKDYFYTACGLSSVKIIKLVLKYVSDLTSGYGIIEAARNYRLETVELLLNYGSDLYFIDDGYYKGALSSAVFWAKSDTDLVEVILYNGADFKTLTRNDINRAISSGPANLLNILLDHGANGYKHGILSAKNSDTEKLIMNNLNKYVEEPIYTKTKVVKMYEYALSR